MKAVGLLGVLIVLVAVGALIYYMLTWRAAKKTAQKASDTPWMPWEDEIDGNWVVQARRPGRDPILLAQAPITDGFLANAVNQARSDAYENFMALTPRGKWNLT